MDSLTSLKLKMEDALKVGNLADALLPLDGLITSATSSSDLFGLFTNHKLNRRPTLHYLADLHFQEEDIPSLNKLIGTFIRFGYYVNKTMEKACWYSGFSQREHKEGYGFTALLASIKQRNLILMECLLRHGARTDICDQLGFTPYHCAISMGDLNCLKKLVELGTTSLASSSAEKSGKMGVHPLLHTAVDEGHLEIVLYLLSKEEIGVDVNEEAVYKYVLTDKESNNRIQKTFTPLGRALYYGNIPIMEALVAHPGTKPSRFKELHSCIENGDPEKALSLVKYFSDEELSTDKIQDTWALHCMYFEAYWNPRFMQFTKKLIWEYVKRGWNPNSVSNPNVYLEYQTKRRKELMTFGKYTLLHLTCLHPALEITKMLVEEAKVDLNSKTEGEVELTPLQVSLRLNNWECAAYLIEKGADLNLRGSSVEIWEVIEVMKRNLITGKLELDSTFNSLELLVTMGYQEGLPLLDQMLAKPDVILLGAYEFHLAVVGLNPSYMYKIAEYCAKTISKEDLSWMTVSEWPITRRKKVAVLNWLLDKLLRLMPGRTDLDDIQPFADLISVLSKLDYDLNSNVPRVPLLFHILKFDLHRKTSNLLLRTILQIDRLEVNVTNLQWSNPVSYLLLKEWNSMCENDGTSICRNDKDLQSFIGEAIRLLVSHGLDVSGMVIDANYQYHEGYKPILKMLCHAGAKISEEFFTANNNVCPWSSREIGALEKEFEEMKEWNAAFERETRLTLKHLCGLRVQKMLKCVGDLKMLDGDELPKPLKENLLANILESLVFLLLMK